MPDKTVLVTGGASGLGLAIARAILARGWRVIVADLDQANLDRCAAELGAEGGQLRTESLDVAAEEDVIGVIARCEAEFGALTGVVNSAGIGKDVPALETGIDLFRRMLEVNLIGSFIVSREAARAMRRNGGGSIVNIASVSGVVGNEGCVAYGASKGGVITMTKVMAVELATAGIRVNAIAPGPIETPLVSAMHTDAARSRWMAAVPQRRHGMPSELAGAAIFLLDEQMSSFVTGQTICVDGGFTISGLLASESDAAA